MICADFLAGRPEESVPEVIPPLSEHLVRALRAEYQGRIIGFMGAGAVGAMVTEVKTD